MEKAGSILLAAKITPVSPIILEGREIKYDIDGYRHILDYTMMHELRHAELAPVIAEIRAYFPAINPLEFKRFEEFVVTALNIRESPRFASEVINDILLDFTHPTGPYSPGKPIETWTAIDIVRYKAVIEYLITTGVATPNCDAHRLINRVFEELLQQLNLKHQDYILETILPWMTDYLRGISSIPEFYLDQDEEGKCKISVLISIFNGIKRDPVYAPIFIVKKFE